MNTIYTCPLLPLYVKILNVKTHCIILMYVQIEYYSHQEVFTVTLYPNYLSNDEEKKEEEEVVVVMEEVEEVEVEEEEKEIEDLLHVSSGATCTDVHCNKKLGSLNHN